MNIFFPGKKAEFIIGKMSQQRHQFYNILNVVALIGLIVFIASLVLGRPDLLPIGVAVFIVPWLAALWMLYSAWQLHKQEYS